jgi:hypothetical protein
MKAIKGLVAYLLLPILFLVGVGTVIFAGPLLWVKEAIWRALRWAIHAAFGEEVDDG